MSKLIVVIVLMLVGIITVSCSVSKNTDDTGVYTRITPEKGKALLADKAVILLDVRTQAEYNQKHIPDSILIPVDVLEKEAEKQLKDKNAEIVVYCRSGNRSRTAANILLRLGYTKVYDMGGIVSWPYETE